MADNDSLTDGNLYSYVSHTIAGMIKYCLAHEIKYLSHNIKSIVQYACTVIQWGYRGVMFGPSFCLLPYLIVVSSNTTHFHRLVRAIQASG